MSTRVFLHGTPLTPAVWRPIAEFLDGVVVAPDCTRVPRGPAAQSELAMDVAGALPAGQWDVVGHSFGAQIALELLLAHPDRVRSLTVLCSRDTPFPAFAPIAEALRSGTAPTVEAGLARWFTPAELAVGGTAVSGARADLTAAVTSPGEWANALDAIAIYDRSSSAPYPDVPTALHAAGLDSVSTPDAMAAFASRFPHATLTVHDGWAHMSPFTDPQALAALLSGAN